MSVPPYQYFFKNTIANGYILSIEDCYTLFNHSPIPLFNHSSFAQIFFPVKDNVALNMLLSGSNDFFWKGF